MAAATQLHECKPLPLGTFQPKLVANLKRILVRNVKVRQLTFPKNMGEPDIEGDIATSIHKKNQVHNFEKSMCKFFKAYIPLWAHWKNLSFQPHHPSAPMLGVTKWLDTCPLEKNIEKHLLSLSMSQHSIALTLSSLSAGISAFHTAPGRITVPKSHKQVI